MRKNLDFRYLDYIFVLSNPQGDQLTVKQKKMSNHNSNFDNDNFRTYSPEDIHRINEWRMQNEIERRSAQASAGPTMMLLIVLAGLAAYFLPETYNINGYVALILIAMAGIVWIGSKLSGGNHGRFH